MSVNTKSEKIEMNRHIFKVLILLGIIFTPLSAVAAKQVFFYHTDPAGTPLAMTDTSGNVVWRADYKPFGEENTVAESQENDKRFVGKEKDEETGHYYFGARYMDPKIGRFTSGDPVGAVDERTSRTNEKLLLNPQNLNPYAYSLNNPYRYVDPDGRVVKLIGSEKEKAVILRDMNKLKEKSQTANKILEKMENSKEVISIRITNGGNSYDISNNVIEYNPDKKYIKSGNDDWHHRDPEVGLGHEAIHSLHDIEKSLGSTREAEESKTVGIGKYTNDPFTENKIRLDYGLKRRPEY